MAFLWAHRRVSNSKGSFNSFELTVFNKYLRHFVMKYFFGSDWMLICYKDKNTFFLLKQWVMHDITFDRPIIDDNDNVNVNEGYNYYSFEEAQR